MKSWPSVPQNVTLFGEEVFKAIIHIKWGHWDGPFASMTSVLTRGRNEDTETKKQDSVRTGEKTTTKPPRGEASEETNPPTLWSWISCFQYSEKINLC